MDEELRAALKEKIKIYNLWKEMCEEKRNDNQFFEVCEEKKRLSRLFTNLKKSKKKLYNKNYPIKMKELMKNDSRKFWSFVNKNKKNNNTAPTILEWNGKVFSNSKERKQAWHDYFKSLFEPINNDNFDNEFDQEINNINLWANEENKLINEQTIEMNKILDKDITIEEVDKAIKKMKEKIAGGNDKILPEMIKHGGNSIIEALNLLFNQILKYQLIPSSWKEGLIYSIFKGGNKNNPSDYRGITLLSIISKLCETIFCNRLVEVVDKFNLDSNNQGGFKRKRSTIDQASVVLFTIQKRQQQKLPTYCAFIDLQKAYDRVTTYGILKRIWDLGINGKFFNLLRNWYQNNKAAVLVENNQTEFFETKIGLKQGSVLSPILFDLFISTLPKEMKELNLGISIDNCWVGMELFADDIAILANSEEELQQMLKVVENWCNKWKMIININKTKLVYFNHKSCKKNIKEIKIYNQIIELVNSYKYLGIDLESDGKWKTMTNNLFKKSNQAINYLSLAGFINHKLPIEINERIAQVSIWSIILYGSELFNQTEDKLNIIMRKVGKKILGCKRSTPNVAVIGDLGWLSYDNLAKNKKLLFLHRLINMNNNFLAKQVFDNCLKNNENFKWFKNIKKILKERNLLNYLNN